MLRIEINTRDADRLFVKLRLIAADTSFDVPLDRAAGTCYRELVLLTPKRWTGMLRRSWDVTKPAEGQRLIFNSVDGDPTHPNKIMIFLEGGTGNAGTPTSHGGYIYPKTARLLYIPMNARASMGWQRGMKFGVDYVLAKRVRGITARHIVRDYRPRAKQNLHNEMLSFLQQALR